MTVFSGVWIGKVVVVIALLVCVLQFQLVQANDQRTAEAMMNSGNFRGAINIFQSLVASNSRDIYATQGLAICYANLGRVDKAASLFETAASISNNHQLYFNAGLAFHQSRDYMSAVRNYEQALAINGRMRPAMIKLASIYRDLDDYMKTQKYLLDAIALEPKNPDAHAYLGDTYNNLKQFDLALKSYKTVLEITPYDVKTMLSLGDTYNNMKNPSMALDTFQRAADTIEYTGNARESMINVQIGMFFASIEMGYWQNYEVTKDTMTKLVRDYNKQFKQFMDQIPPEQAAMNPNEMMPPNPLSPYRLMFFDAESDLYTDIPNQWSSGIVRGTSGAKGVYEKKSRSHRRHKDDDQSDKISVGYISRRFYNYPGTQMMIRNFPNHNRSLIYTATIANGPDDSSKYRSFIRENSDVHIDVTDDSVDEKLRKINDLNLDVIIDYDGLHDFNSLSLLSQIKDVTKITWLGFAGPTGIDGTQEDAAINYIISDKQILSPDLKHVKAYREKILYLPDSYQPQDELRAEGILWDRSDTSPRNQSIATPFNTRSMLLSADLYVSGRQQERLLFLEECNYALKDPNALQKLASSIWLTSFNRISKISPDAFEDWMQIMIERPQTVLVLMEDVKNVKRNILNQAALHGIHKDRIVFIPRVNMALYRRVLQNSDIFLDTRHYNAHTVASDSMNEGTAVATIAGETFASRVASSLNSAMGISNLLTFVSRKDFVDSITQLFPSKVFGDLDHELSRRLRSHVLDKRGVCLFNSLRFTKRMEHALEAVKSIKEVTERNDKFYNIFSEIDLPTCHTETRSM